LRRVRRSKKRPLDRLRTIFGEPAPPPGCGAESIRLDRAWVPAASCVEIVQRTRNAFSVRRLVALLQAGLLSSDCPRVSSSASAGPEAGPAGVGRRHSVCVGSSAEQVDRHQSVASAVGHDRTGLWLERVVAKRHRHPRHSRPHARILSWYGSVVARGMRLHSSRNRRAIRSFAPVLRRCEHLHAIQLVSSAGEGRSRRMAERCGGLTDPRSRHRVAAIETLGASMVKSAVEPPAETRPQERQQQIEEQAQKAP